MSKIVPPQSVGTPPFQPPATPQRRSTPPGSQQAPKISTSPRITMPKSSSSSSPSVPPASAASVTAAARPLPATYEAALSELEQLVSGLESGQLPLDQLLSGYQRGAQLLKFCRDQLEAVETQVKVLEGSELKPWASE